MDITPEHCSNCIFKDHPNLCNILNKKVCLRFQCDICTYKNNPNMCAMGVGDIDNPICPGFDDNLCESCGSYPCICPVYDNDLRTMMEGYYDEKSNDCYRNSSEGTY